MTEKLLPCPNLKCRNTCLLIMSSNGHQMQCGRCGTTGPKADTPTKALKKWNTHFLRDTKWIKIGDGPLPEGESNCYFMSCGFRYKGRYYPKEGVFYIKESDTAFYKEDVTHYYLEEDPGTP
ncbi:MAG: hypothetical protein KAS32_08935 [Candidatus Peribacteraceae bacterium]|nr:hypothetical protein [Candidatus Peribacteraceae bacterium]